MMAVNNQLHPLQPQSPDGFLQDIFNHISLQKDPGIWQNQDLSISIQRFNFLASFKQTGFKKYLLRPSSSSSESSHHNNLGKNRQLSGAFREKGNILYKNGDYRACLSVYNQALLLAPKDEDIFSISLANRSAVWFTLKEYDYCIRDIDRALDNSYPDSMKIKLLERKARAQIYLHRRQDAQQTYQEFLKYMKVTDFKEAIKAKKVQDFTDDFLKINDKLKVEIVEPSSLANLTPNASGFNSETVEIKRSPVQGRYTVAKRNIKPGEPFCIDTPHVKHLDKELIKSHCWHCLNKTNIPLPCENCSGVIFCSDQCNIDANQSYHKYECGLTDIIQQAGVGTWNLSYRALTSRPYEFWKDYNPLNSKDSKINKFWDLEAQQTNDGYYTAPGLMKEALVVVFFVRCLQATSYFDSDSMQILGDNLGGRFRTQAETICAERLIHLMRITSFNSHELTEMTSGGATPSSTSTYTVRRIGVGINPYLALINHSCDPNYGRVWNPKSGLITGYATRFIPSGTEITDSYSGIFCNMTVEERSVIHDRYHFRCKCKPCVERWPKLRELPFIWPSKSIAKRLKPMYEEILYNPTLENCSQFLNLAWNQIKSPHSLLIAVEDRLHKCLLRKYGSVSVYSSSILSLSSSSHS